jgi:hypothetical protein
MHEEYDNYGDDDYDDSHDDLESQYKHYFKFDPEAWDAWGKMLYDALNDIVESSPNVWYIGGFQPQKFPVSSYFSNAGKDKTFQYLGSNYQGAEVWKKKYFVLDPLQHHYINHIQSHAVHFINQPHYYKGMFDILN